MPPCPHLMGISAMRCRPLAVTLKVMRPAIQRPSVARYMALRKANHRIELETCSRPAYAGTLCSFPSPHPPSPAYHYHQNHRHLPPCSPSHRREPHRREVRQGAGVVHQQQRGGVIDRDGQRCPVVDDDGERAQPHLRGGGNAAAAVGQTVAVAVSGGRRGWAAGMERF